LAAGFVSQPVTASPSTTKQPIPKMRLNAFFLTQIFLILCHPEQPDAPRQVTPEMNIG
jgi:hypothetical protein